MEVIVIVRHRPDIRRQFIAIGAWMTGVVRVYMSLLHGGDTRRVHPQPEDQRPYDKRKNRMEKFDIDWHFGLPQLF